MPSVQPICRYAKGLDCTCICVHIEFCDHIDGRENTKEFNKSKLFENKLDKILNEVCNTKDEQI